MTLAELLAALGDRPIARHRGTCLFTVSTAEEAEEWQGRGARVHSVAAYGRTAWEVHPAYCLPEQDEADDDGSPIDTRPAFLLAYLRDRDGYSLPWRAEWADG